MSERNKFNIKIITPQGSDDRILEGDTFSIGRGGECTLPLLYDKVSRKHLQCTFRNGQIWIEDLGSSNGTYVNDTLIAPFVPWELQGSEKIKIGNSEIYLTIQQNGPQNLAKAVSGVEVPSDVLSPLEKKPTESEKIEVPGAVSPQLLLKHARSKASSIILEAESAAEKRVQEIYQRAKETQKKAEDFYRLRLQSAHDDANKLIEDVGEEGRELVVDARTRAQSVRDEVERYASDLREKTQDECETLLKAAEMQAKELKERTLLEQEQALRTKEKSILGAANSEVARLRERTLAETNQKLAAELAEHQNKIETLKKDTEVLSRQSQELKSLKMVTYEELQKKQSELALINAKISEERIGYDNLLGESVTLKKYFESLQGKIASLSSEKNSLSENIDRISKQKIEHESELASLKQAIVVLEQSSTDLKFSTESCQATHQRELKELELLQTKISEAKVAKKQAQQDQVLAQGEVDSLLKQKQVEQADLVKLSMDQERANKEIEKLTNHIGSLTEKISFFTKQLEAENSTAKDKLEASKTRYSKMEEEYVEKLRLETTARFSKVESELMQQLHAKKDILAREIVLHAEAIFQNDISRDSWKRKSKELEKQTLQLLSGQEASLNGKSIESSSEKKFIIQKKREQQYRIAMGAIVGVALVLGVQAAMLRLSSNISPLQERAELASKEKLEELEQRRFEPKQVNSLKETYTDSVIYTKKFTVIYLNSDYQKRWFAAATSYLLRTWRLDEAVSIQVLSTAAALVKSLEERRQAIHPDFVKESVQKMHELEKDSTDRLAKTLGSQVRFESFKKFEKEYFEKELKKP